MHLRADRDSFGVRVSADGMAPGAMAAFRAVSAIATDRAMVVGVSLGPVGVDRYRG